MASVPQRFAGLEHVLDPVKGLLLVDERQEALALQLQEALLGDLLGYVGVASGEHEGDLRGYDRVVGGGLPGVHELAHEDLKGRLTRWSRQPERRLFRRRVRYGQLEY